VEDGVSGTEPPPLFAWKSFLQLGSEAEVPSHRALHEPHELALVLYTGATTGVGTGVMHSDRQLTAVSFQTQVQGPLLAGQSVLSAVPLSHGYGVSVAVHATLSAGATSVLVPHSTSRSLALTIRRIRPEYLIGVPSTYTGLVFDRVFRRTRERSLMGAFCGGDRLPWSVRELFERIVRRRGGAVAIREGYGLTETVTACATMPEGEIRPGSVGIPYPDTLIAIASPLVGVPELADAPPSWLPADTIGEILVSGPTVMEGYLDRPQESTRVIHPDDEGRRWLRTGDLGRMDEDGFLYFVERMGRGQTVHGAEVHPGITELSLSVHPEVLESSVTVQEDAGETQLVAHVVPVDKERDYEWLERRLRESMKRLTARQQPVRYEFYGRLPRTLAGVVDHRRLAATPSRVLR